MFHPQKIPTWGMIFPLRGGRGPGLRLTIGGMTAGFFVAGAAGIRYFKCDAADWDKSAATLSGREPAFRGFDESRRQAYPDDLA
jgi:hypothetical protein